MLLRPGRPRGVVLLLAVLLFVSLPILFNVRVRVRWSQWDTQSISLDTEPPVQSDALVMAEIARNDSWRPRTVEAFNAHFEHILDICTSGGPCSKNHDKLILLAWGHFAGMIQGALQGENIWCDSMVDALHALGYSMIIANGRKEFTRYWTAHHDRIQLILWNGPDSKFCLDDPGSCIITDPFLPLNPPNATHLNVPLWRVLRMHWWTDVDHPLGALWTVSPEDYSTWNNNGRNNTYLGYSLEKSCLKTSYVPLEQRPRRVFVLAKFTKYFASHYRYIFRDNLGMKNTFFKDISERLGLSFVGALKKNDGFDVPLGISQLPRMAQPAFQATIASSRLLLGIGSPPMSPSPWEALCLGVPFINPVHSWDKRDPENKMKWGAQHDALLHSGIPEPYVFNVKLGDIQDLERAIATATETSIPRYIPPAMTIAAVIERMRIIVERDWLKEAQSRALSFEGIGHA